MQALQDKDLAVADAQGELVQDDRSPSFFECVWSVFMRCRHDQQAAAHCRGAAEDAGCDGGYAFGVQHERSLV
jgi:hypothetical protein